MLATQNLTTEILPTNTAERFAIAVARAVALLRAGEVVALPTETVYGLAANALEARAVDRIFAAKDRPAHNPIIVHVADTAMAQRCVADWNEAADRLATAFWPGPLTLVLPKAPILPDNVTAGGSTVGVRCPRHPLIQAVIRGCGFPLAAPSANRSNEVSPTQAEHVRHSLGGRIPLIVDGGPTQVGIESTVVDLTQSPPRVLRPGMIHDEALRAAVGALSSEVFPRPTDARAPVASGPLRSPGQLARHYAPRAPLVSLAWTDEADLHRQVERLGWEPHLTQVLAHAHIPGAGGWGGVSVIPHDPEAFARALYAALHRCDEAGARGIVVEAVPDSPGWSGIADRLRRAAAR